jgi:hypothetical protein
MRTVWERDPRHVPMQVECPNSPPRGNVRICLFNDLKRPVEHSKVGRQFNSGIDDRFEVCQGLAAIGADFVFDGNEIRGLEQNPETESVGRKWLGVAKT